MTSTAPPEFRFFEPTSDAGRSSSRHSNFDRSGPVSPDTASSPDAEDRSSCLDTFAASSAPDFPAAFKGELSLISPESLGTEEVGTVLARLAALASWAVAQQARVVHRMEVLIAAEVEETHQRPDEGLALSLTAAEAGAVLNIPHMSALQLVSDSAQLCGDHTATLAALSHGQISHRHARAVLDQLQGIPRSQLLGFEAELLSAARGRTCAQFTRTARRLRERQWPETIATRHRSALDRRRVSFDPVADGMGELCARIAVEKGQAIFNALTFAAEGERKAGDPRTMDQLRADIFTSLMLHSNGMPPSKTHFDASSKPPSASSPRPAGPSMAENYLSRTRHLADRDPANRDRGDSDPANRDRSGSSRRDSPGRDPADRDRSGRDPADTERSGSSNSSGSSERDSSGRGPADSERSGPDRDLANKDQSASGSEHQAVVDAHERAGGSPEDGDSASATGSSGESGWDDSSGMRAEIMVLISAETLFGNNDHCAELSGVGPISAEAARRLAEQALHWTGLVQDPSTGQILAVGRRRKVPAGLKRWLQARDGTCRFPGCRVGPARTEIDHTRPWASGGLTEHGNLANLCPKHHRYKTLGFWRSRQKEPGFLEWISPLGRVYRTSPQLHYAPVRADATVDSASPPIDSDPPPF
ncbi:DUF222 domain-containing protein [Arthrobacter sp. Sa2CUA1]|uniref:DUF222 domain-containing protein n=1 Tax=Arthrobacter gallicola TaxID=2762225 RepID=A0ABR8UUN7_9MICC|nr:DUF222 domain-containing protein [Arthrobacter gallicola]